MNRESLEQLVERDPGDSAFGELADLLLDQGEVDRALRVCLAGLSANPGFHQGRLTLAKIFQSAGYLPFAIRELEQLERALPETKSISKLLERLAPDRVRPAGLQQDEPLVTKQQTIAEQEFDLGDLEGLEDS